MGEAWEEYQWSEVQETAPPQSRGHLMREVEVFQQEPGSSGCQPDTDGIGWELRAWPCSLHSFIHSFSTYHVQDTGLGLHLNSSPSSFCDLGQVT